MYGVRDRTRASGLTPPAPFSAASAPQTSSSSRCNAVDIRGDQVETADRARSLPAGRDTWLTWTKVGRILDGGGWRIHGRNSVQAKAAGRAKAAGVKRGYVYLHSNVDSHSRLAYTEPLDDEKGATAASFLARAKVWYAAHGIDHIQRIVTDDGACYRSGDFAGIAGNQSRHQKTKPYTPRHNGKVERSQPPARTWQSRRGDAAGRWGLIAASRCWVPVCGWSVGTPLMNRVEPAVRTVAAMPEFRPAGAVSAWRTRPTCCSTA